MVKMSSAVNGAPTVVWYFLTNFELLSMKSTRFITAECVSASGFLFLLRSACAFDMDALKIISRATKKNATQKIFFEFLVVAVDAVGAGNAACAAMHSLLLWHC